MFTYLPSVLHGSPEHIDAVRSLHEHHETQQNQLKVEHSDVFEKFDHVRTELDLLNAELHMLTGMPIALVLDILLTGSDHSVALDASFDKFGYSAHLRTTDDSETSSLNSEHSSAQQKHQDRSTNPLKFFRRPQVRQYFHKGLLWRSAKAGEVASFELFLDLVYVGVIDIIGERAVEHPDGLSLLHFVIMFSIGWKIWSDMVREAFLMSSSRPLHPVLGRVCCSPSPLFELPCRLKYRVPLKLLYSCANRQNDQCDQLVRHRRYRSTYFGRLLPDMPLRIHYQRLLHV